MVQWLSGDFDSMRILVPEYTIGYASTQAFMYEPGKTPEPVEMQLEEQTGMGKTHASRWYCWVSKWYDVGLCEPTRDGDPESTVCTDETWRPAEITCVCLSGCGDDDDGGGGGDDGGDDDGDDTGGGDDDGEEEEDDPEDEEEITFSMECAPQSVTRGGTVSCTASVTTPEGMDKQRHQFDWSSSINIRDKAATMSETHTNPTSTWDGVATEGAKITVLIGEEKFESDITVTARSGYGPPELGNDPPLTAVVTYSSEVRQLKKYGEYSFGDRGTNPQAPGAESGTGPWSGTYMVGDVSALDPKLFVSDDYDEPGIGHSGAHSVTCRTAAEDLSDQSESYYSVNKYCRTSTGFNLMRRAIIDHERVHEKGFNRYLESTTASNLFTALEAIVKEKSSEVDGAITDAWTKFITALDTAGGEAPAYLGGSNEWWYYVDFKWGIGVLTIDAH